MRNIRLIISILVIPLPWVIRRFFYRTLLGYKISDGAWIGRSIVSVNCLFMGGGSRIGSMTIVRNLESLDMGESSRIGSFNWIFGLIDSQNKHFRASPERKSVLKLSAHAAITARHIIDCIDAVSIGFCSILAGHRSQVLTHSVDLYSSEQTCGPVTIGDYCFVGTGCIVLKGAKLPDYSILGAGSVFSRAIEDENYFLYSGNPAKPIKSLGSDLGYFNRKIGVVE